jgi:hypothetical protein
MLAEQHRVCSCELAKQNKQKDRNGPVSMNSLQVQAAHSITSSACAVSPTAAPLPPPLLQIYCSSAACQLSSGRCPSPCAPYMFSPPYVGGPRTPCESSNQGGKEAISRAWSDCVLRTVYYTYTYGMICPHPLAMHRNTSSAVSCAVKTPSPAATPGWSGSVISTAGGASPVRVHKKQT